MPLLAISPKGYFDVCETYILTCFCFRYMAPEYFMHGITHEKTDVFAFGVVLLELITGHRAVNSDRQGLVKWVCFE